MRPLPSTVAMSTSVGLSLLAVMVTIWLASSAPPPGPMPEKATLPDAESSSTVTAETALNRGASFTPLTVTETVATDPSAVPSLAKKSNESNPA